MINKEMVRELEYSNTLDLVSILVELAREANPDETDIIEGVLFERLAWVRADEIIPDDGMAVEIYLDGHGPYQCQFFSGEFHYSHPSWGRCVVDTNVYIPREMYWRPKQDGPNGLSMEDDE